MNTYLCTWNPKIWPWNDLNQDIESCKKNCFLDDRWSCGNTKKIEPGDRIFLIKLGHENPNGIMASGFALSHVFEDEHYSDEKRKALYVKVRFDVVLHPYDENILLKNVLKEKIPAMKWSPQASGVSIKSEDSTILENLWTSHLKDNNLSPVTLPEEIVGSVKYYEGAMRRIFVNAYERDPRARESCINKQGTSCCICGFNFESVYGQIGIGFIHVHHIKPISEIGRKYEINPSTDLIPVCPNCHSMLHIRNEEPLSIEELKMLINKKTNC
jgi:5-methylcytosine-specific restriction protein A